MNIKFNGPSTVPRRISSVVEEPSLSSSAIERVLEVAIQFEIDLIDINDA